jgi:hypothetical protein
MAAVLPPENLWLKIKLIVFNALLRQFTKYIIK